MNSAFHSLQGEKIEAMRKAGTLKRLRYLESPMDARVIMEGRGEIIVLSSNNYLGLSNNPEVIAAGVEALEKYGAGTASVRFICGTFTQHRELEKAIAELVGTKAALSFVSCWNANTGVIPVAAGEGDALISDELNHASMIDGCRMSKARRLIYKHADMADLEARLKEAAGAKTKLVLTDGVFSMEGDIAPLPDIIELAEKYGAATLVDDSHGAGVMGKTGRGTAEHFGVLGKIDIITGTLGKALGGAAGGFVASSGELVEMLTQAARPQIFSNALPVTVAASAAKAIEILRREPKLVDRLRSNAAYFRAGLKKLGFKPLDAESAIIPIIVGETASAIRMSEELLNEGVFVTGFGYPVVPEGRARLRVQMSAALGRAEMDKALDAFRKVGGKLKTA